MPPAHNHIVQNCNADSNHYGNHCILVYNLDYKTHVAKIFAITFIKTCIEESTNKVLSPPTSPQDQPDQLAPKDESVKSKCVEKTSALASLTVDSTSPFDTKTVATPHTLLCVPIRILDKTLIDDDTSGICSTREYCNPYFEARDVGNDDSYGVFCPEETTFACFGLRQFIFEFELNKKMNTIIKTSRFIF